MEAFFFFIRITNYFFNEWKMGLKPVRYYLKFVFVKRNAPLTKWTNEKKKRLQILRQLHFAEFKLKIPKQYLKIAKTVIRFTRLPVISWLDSRLWNISKKATKTKCLLIKEIHHFEKKAYDLIYL